MLRVRIISSAKPLRILGNKAIFYQKYQQDETTRLSSLVHLSFNARSIHLSSSSNVVTARDLEPNILKRMVQKIKDKLTLDTTKFKRKYIAHLLYEDIANNIDYDKYFSDFKLPDTFNSWFVITELHVWMLMIRFMAEGKSGHEMRNNIVEAMWGDVNERRSKLKGANVIASKKQLIEISKQFNAAIIDYDEGIMSDDKSLAGALWRRFYACQGNDPELLEKLVELVRKQVKELDRISTDEVMEMRSTEWLSYLKNKDKDS